MSTAAFDIAQIRGHVIPRRAIEIAAAGQHPILFSGPPGVGKTLLARALHGLLPAMSPKDRDAVSQVHEDARMILTGQTVDARPFRAPHHTVSTTGLLGCWAGGMARPGEVSLSHAGVLFLDDLPEFRRDALEALTWALHTRIRTIQHGGRIEAEWPASPLLVGAMCACPCGWSGYTHRTCRCTAEQVQRYQSRVFSGPLRDEFDLIVNVEHQPRSVLTMPEGEPTSAVAARVAAAREFRAARPADPGGMTARARVARTIADLAGRLDVTSGDLDEAATLTAE
jgi:magnesium chelatase family protein